MEKKMENEMETGIILSHKVPVYDFLYGAKYLVCDDLVCLGEIHGMREISTSTCIGFHLQQEARNPDPEP